MMNTTSSVSAAVFVLALAGVAHADTVPKPTRAYASNYKTLVADQKAPPRMAACIASAHDYAKAGQIYDRLGFTDDDISAARTSNQIAPFSASDPRFVSAVLSVSGIARRKAGDGGWMDITLRCGDINGTLQAIELIARK